MTKEEHAYHEAAGQCPDADKSQMFGKPCYKINGKAFVAFFQNDMVFKLAADQLSEALALAGAHLFDPSGKGRPMKEWVQIPSAHIHTWSRFTVAAYDFVFQKSK